ncbi:MAG TPA: SGNH/GDSL hydrolase family protein, partial [Isosphaeraceae bacterium]|nr:SGNH/GDSL hydrolase family protein [Isosphaeraceae bacterium]
MKPRASRSRWRAVGFRLAALGVGLLPLLLCELTLHAFDVGRSIPPEDPFVGFSATYPLFELDPTRTRYQTAANRLVYFQRDTFAAHKSPREYRVFVFGGSTVQGRPFAIETAFSTWLELSLQAADPSRVWQVVNCGGVSYASYRLAPIVDEILHYKPDLVILCTGHNEYLEDRSYDTLKSVPGGVRWPLEVLSNTRTARLLEGLVRSVSEPEEQKRPLLAAEVDAMLDYRGGLARYHRDDAWHSGV